MIKKMFMAMGGGAISFYTELGLTILFTEFLGWNPELSYFVAIIFGLIILFLIFRYKTFKVKTAAHKQIIRFFIVYVVYYIINWLLVVLLLQIMPYYLAIIIVNIITWPPTFILNNYWVFNKNKRNKLNIFKQIKSDFSNEWKRIFFSHRCINNSNNPKNQDNNIKKI